MAGPKTLLDALEGGDPNSPALLCSGDGPKLSRAQLKEQCIIFAEAIRRAGVKSGDAVSIVDTNTVRPVTTCMPCSQAWKRAKIWCHVL